MHYSAQVYVKHFFDVYVNNPNASIVEIGSLDVGGGIREYIPSIK